MKAKQRKGLSFFKNLVNNDGFTLSLMLNIEKKKYNKKKTSKNTHGQLGPMQKMLKFRPPNHLATGISSHFPFLIILKGEDSSFYQNPL
jgi:hypothetical protein